MEFKPLVALAVFLSIINIGATLKCYACGGSGKSDCAKGITSSMVIQTCTNTSYSAYAFDDDDDDDAPNDNATANYQTICVQLFETEFKPRLFGRGCGIVPANVDPCTFIAKYIPSTGCKSCKTDLCNKRRQRTQGGSVATNRIS